MPTSGQILLNGEDIAQLPPHKRPLNTVFQRYALFSHLDVYDNIAFGLKLKKVPYEVTDKAGNKVTKYRKYRRDEINEKVKKALKIANISAQDVDYVNLHGTGTISNDLTESVAVHAVFEGKITAGSTKPLTGHCLGAASSLETALCCKLIENGEKKVFPHVFDGQYDENLPKIKLADKKTVLNRLKTCLNLSFGFGGTNAAIILRGKNDRHI